MKLVQILNQLSHGELAQYYEGGDGYNGIHDDRFNKVIPHINLALSALYTRFPLKMEEVVIQQADQIQTYYLDSKYAVTNKLSTEELRYIIDSLYHPFVDNVLKIERVFNEQGRELFLNDADEYWSVHTPTYNSIQIPYPDLANQLIVTYRAGPKQIPIEELQPEFYDVDLPADLLEHLLLYVGGRMTAIRDSSEGDYTSQNYFKRYEEACL